MHDGIETQTLCAEPAPDPRLQNRAVESHAAGGRILMVSHAAELGGAEQGLLDVARHFGPARCDAVLFTDSPLRHLLEARGIKVHVLGADERVLGVRRQGGVLRVLHALPSGLSLAVRLKRLAKPYGILYPNSQKAAFVAMLAGAAARKKVIWHLHDILSAEHFGTLQRRMIALLSHRFAHAVIVVSAAARTALIRSGGNPSRIHLIHNGIDPVPYTDTPDLDVMQLRQKHGLPPGRLVGLFGRITPWKGQRVLIKALPALPDTHAVIVGSPMFGQDAELIFLRKMARDLDVAHRVHFLGYRADTPELMRAVDLVLHCSIAPEPFGRVIVEALFAGTPILAADSGASTEILGHEPGWRVKPDDPAALAAAIDTFFATDPLERAARIQAMRAHVTTEFSLARMMASVDKVVAEVSR